MQFHTIARSVHVLYITYTSIEVYDRIGILKVDQSEVEGDFTLFYHVFFCV